jgi:hypothetical protein
LAEKVDAHNLLEGCTCAKTIMGYYNYKQMHFAVTDQQQVLCHCDDTLGKNYSLIASQVQNYEEDCIIWIAVIGYARNTVFDYVKHNICQYLLRLTW